MDARISMKQNLTRKLSPKLHNHASEWQPSTTELFWNNQLKLEMLSHACFRVIQYNKLENTKRLR